MDAMTSDADHIAIRRVIDRYFAAIDRANKTLLAQCFTADALYRSSGGTLDRAGRDAICEKLASGRFAWTSHVTSSMTVAVDGDEATADTYAVAYLNDRSADPERMVVRGVQYLDTLRRTSEGWLIAQRHHLTQWQFETPAVQPWMP